MNIIRLSPDIEFDRPLTAGEFRAKAGMVAVAPMSDMDSDHLGYSEVAQWRQVAFHDEMADAPGMPPTQAESHGRQRDVFLGKLGVVSLPEALAA